MYVTDLMKILSMYYIIKIVLICIINFYIIILQIYDNLMSNSGYFMPISHQVEEKHTTALPGFCSKKLLLWF